MEGGGLEGEEAVGNCLGNLVDKGSRDSRKYYLSRRTVLEMLRDRGYDVPLSEINLSLQDFRAIHGQDPDVDRLRISVTHRSHPSKRIVVFFCGPGMIKVNVIRSIATQIVNKDSLSGLILILQNQITNQALKAVDLFPFKVELFQIMDLLVNITKHVLKPHHHVLTDQEKERVLKKYCIEEKQYINYHCYPTTFALTNHNLTIITIPTLTTVKLPSYIHCAISI
ncbi:DNA-directed RNA polymerases IV and V subunit 5B-like isoform X2 [Mangifera indica]|uniref:DNA-directed RNA polymerases IV and V subunit 5B-like isoform X2 n=1 Tax=Mangifera indica TaxID=29780 RepID=UPI001CFB0E9F|nr:DNA-directed RNA polymerases IV and V subunit 5B-like isoform X2 [Mangifera indica]